MRPTVAGVLKYAQNSESATGGGPLVTVRPSTSLTAGQLAGVAGVAFAAALLISAESVIHAQALALSQSNGPPASPMALLTYQDARPWARAIEQKVTSREMPPWHIDRSIGEYLEDPSLSDREVALIGAWVDNGAPEGRAADAPPARVFPPHTEWTYGEPDLIVRMQKGFRIPANGPDFIPEEIVDPGLTEAHYHPYGEETFDRQRVGNDWVLNRERLENPLHAAVLLSRCGRGDR